MATYIGKWDNFKKEVENTPEFLSEKIAMKISLEVDKHLENIEMSKKDFAKLLGVSKPYVSQLLQGENNMTIYTVCKIAMALDLQPVIQFKEQESCSDPLEEDIEKITNANISYNEIAKWQSDNIEDKAATEIDRVDSTTIPFSKAPLLVAMVSN
jgi:transcriptional regulator with XRE-family HTH domain